MFDNAFTMKFRKSKDSEGRNIELVSCYWGKPFNAVKIADFGKITEIKYRDGVAYCVTGAKYMPRIKDCYQRGICLDIAEARKDVFSWMISYFNVPPLKDDLTQKEFEAWWHEQHDVKSMKEKRKE